MGGKNVNSNIFVNTRSSEFYSIIKLYFSYVLMYMYVKMHYNELRRFNKNKLEVSDDIFKALNKIKRFTKIVAINSKTKTRINILF